MLYKTLRTIPSRLRSSRGNLAAMSLTIAGPVRLPRPCGFIYCFYSRYAIALNLQLSIGILLADQHPVRLFAGALPGQFIGQGPFQLYQVIAPLDFDQQGTSAVRHSSAEGVTSQLAYLLDPSAICHNSKTPWGTSRGISLPPPRIQAFLYATMNPDFAPCAGWQGQGHVASLSMPR